MTYITNFDEYSNTGLKWWCNIQKDDVTYYIKNDDVTCFDSFGI